MSVNSNGSGATNEIDDLVAVARAVKVRGVRGEVVAELLTSFPERFAEIEHLFVIESGERKDQRRLKLEAHWLHQGRVVLKFEGYDSPEAASALVGCEFAVTEAECVRLDEDEFFEWQLVGCLVETVSGVEVGTVREVLETGSAPVLVIHDRNAREHLVPLAATICVEIDITQKLIRIDAPEGLLEL